MKRTGKALLALGIAVMLAGCGQPQPAGNMAQNITMGSTNGSQKDTARDGGAGAGTEQGQALEASDQESSREEGAFGFLYEGVTLIPGAVFDKSSLGGTPSVSEIPSCAFDGCDNEYNYESFVLTAHIGENEEIIYSIYFVDPNLPTTEGLCLGDTVEDMKTLYGENYNADGGAYDYTRGETVLSVIAQNDIIVSIEYRLNK